MKKIRWDLVGIFGAIAAVLIGAYKVVEAGGSGSIYIAIGLVVIFGSMGFIIYKFIWGPKLNVQRLKKTGIPGNAKILEVQTTNISINNNPQVKLLMEVKNNMGQVYTTECKTIVPKRNPGQFKPGMDVSIKIDPKNEKNVIVDAG